MIKLSLPQKDYCKTRKDTKYCINTKPLQTMGATKYNESKTAQIFVLITLRSDYLRHFLL